MNQLHCSTSLPSIGYLRSARLYPLGVVDTPLLQPPELLGIVASKSTTVELNLQVKFFYVADSRRIGDRRRPVSWVETRTRAELDKRKANSERDRERDRHSFSGYPEGRSRLISLPKNTALVPTASMSVESARKQKQTNIFTSGQSQAHPPLVSQKLAACEEGQEIRVEVRSSRESSDSNRQPVEDQTASGGTLPHLPPVTNLSSSQLQQPRIKESERKISQQISIVSVGATGTSVVRQQRQVQWRRQRSPDRRDGRLSLGWTQTKPLGPLTGFSVYRDTESRTQTRGELSGSKEAKTALGGGGAGEAVVSKDCILIDVQEYLANIN